MKKYSSLFTTASAVYEICIPAFNDFKCIRHNVPDSTSQPKQCHMKKRIFILVLSAALYCSTSVFAMSPPEKSSLEDLRAIVSFRQPNHRFKDSDFVNALDLLNPHSDKKQQTEQERKNLLSIINITVQSSKETSETPQSSNFMQNLCEYTAVPYKQ